MISLFLCGVELVFMIFQQLAEKKEKKKRKKKRKEWRKFILPFLLKNKIKKRRECSKVNKVIINSTHVVPFNSLLSF